MADFSFQTFVLVISAQTLLLCAGVLVVHRTQESVFLTAFCSSVVAYFCVYLASESVSENARLWLAPAFANETLPAPLLLGFVSTTLHGRLTKVSRAALLLPIIELGVRYGLLATSDPHTNVFVAIGQLTLFCVVGYAVWMLLRHRSVYLNATSENRLPLIYVLVAPALFAFTLNMAWVVTSLLANGARPPHTEVLAATTLLFALAWPFVSLLTGKLSFQRVDTELREEPRAHSDGGEKDQDTESTETREDQRWKALKTFVESAQIYLDPELTLVQLAKEMGTNRAALSRLINARVNGNFNDFINGYRVAHAQKLLVTTQDPIIDIGLASGFNSKATFNRVFRKRTGKTPSETRTGL